MVWMLLGEVLQDVVSDMECVIEKGAGVDGEERINARFPAAVRDSAETENGKKTEAEAPASLTSVRSVKQSDEKLLCKPKDTLRCLTTDNPVRRTLRGAVGKHLKLVWSQ